MPHAPQFALSKSVFVQTPLQSVRPPTHAPHTPWLQYGVCPAQTYPQAPQWCGSEFMLVHVPLQQAVPVGQQTKFPQLPQSRLVLPLHDRQAFTHWFRRFLVGQNRQKAVHRSGLAAQAVPSPQVLSTVPANAVPMPRSESRRDTDVASNFDNSSRRSMINTSLDGKLTVIRDAASFAANTNTFTDAPRAAKLRGADNATPAAVS